MIAIGVCLVRPLLKEKRLEAALASGGTSTSASIYSTAQKLLKELNVQGSVLDFGAGRGQFSKILLSLSGIDSVTGMDMFPRPTSMGANFRWVRVDLNDLGNFKREAFDVVVSLEVIEHLENPRETCRCWMDLLRPGGTLIFSTPNNESIRSLISLVFRGHYVDFGSSNYPAHITPLLRVDIRRVLSEVGFEQKGFYYTNQGAIPSLTSVSWQQLSLNFLKGRLFSDNVFVVARKPSFSNTKG